MAIICFALYSVILPAQSYYTARLDDPKAIYLTPEQFPVRADGVNDDADGLQQAIDRVQETTRTGIVFVPEGKYRLGKTIYVWPGIRLIGYGAQRPVFILAENTPGFQEGSRKYMVFFAGGRPRASGEPVRDGNPGTFYSAMSNIDMEIRDGNPAAVAVRFHIAQHSYLAHMNFRIGSGKAALEDIGNEGEDLHFFGGDYGIVTGKTSPSWQYLLIDSSFEGQRVAAIKTHEAGLTLVRDRFKSVPTAIAIDPEFAEELWLEDCRFEDISGPALVISNENNARTQVNAEDLACSQVPVFASFRQSGKRIAAPAPTYLVKQFSHGLHLADIGDLGTITTTFEATPAPKMPAAAPSDILDLPARDTWKNVHTLGVKGDGQTDDTAALQTAIARHRTLYLPMGRYRVTDTLVLRPETVLIGLHPAATVIDLPDSTPAFQGPGAPKALLEAPRGGSNIVTGIGLYTGGINGRAVAAKWMAGKDSMMNDVRFLGGHGTNRADGTREEVYNNTHTADPDLNRRWDGQYYSLWITNGGGGTFKDIWTPSTFSQAGMCISDTTTEGRVYLMSIEHHVRNEVILRRAANWKLYALQFEEERGESAEALPLEIDGCSNITLANTFLYRVVSSYAPFPYAVRIADSHDIRFRNLHSYTDCRAPFDSTIFDRTSNLRTRENEFAVLTIGGDKVSRRPSAVSRSAGAGKVEKLTGGFYNIAGLAVDPAGEVYFTDPRRQSIYRWSVEQRQLTLVRDNPVDPVQLAFDKSGNMLVVSYAGKGTVFVFRPESREDEIVKLEPQSVTPRPGSIPVLPVNRYRNSPDFLEKTTEVKAAHYLSPDGSIFIPADEDFVKGVLYYGAKMSDLMRAFGLAPAVSGRPFFVCNEPEQKTYAFQVGPDGRLSEPKLFVEKGGQAVVTDREGNVYIAAGRIFVYDPSGRLLNTIDVPERPSGLVFGGKDRKTLFIAARTSLYAWSAAKEDGLSRVRPQ
ncbi:MAG: gluconolaconase [Acidobacteria bacterium]|nr:MAG: gluconolaconase [Acidobacteriota bacterium]